MHYALLCPPFKSHVAVFQTLAAELVRRGHRVTFFLNAGAEYLVSAGFEVQSVAGTNRWRLQRIVDRASRPTGPIGILRTVHDTAILSHALCAYGPAKLRALGVEAILGDQMEPAAGLVATYLGIPLISIACAVPVNRDVGIPLPFLPWPYDPSPEGNKRNRGGERVARLFLHEQRRLIRKWSNRFGIEPPRKDLQGCLSALATIAQTTVAFDFPVALRMDGCTWSVP